ncbi:MAG TPA: PKD domain-containing protein [Candidatus Hydrogenedentes bacterium]|nr:PKD domain-containing protein [Candidatus Hydrogenedentota bacterium]
MSIKYGATTGLALAALVLLGVIGMAPDQPQGAAAPQQLASIAGVPPSQGPVHLAAVPKTAKAAFTCEGNLLADPSFESGSPNEAWQESSTGLTPLCDAECDGTLHSRTGEWWVWFSGNADAATDGAVWQTVIIPQEEEASLTFYLAIPQAETPLSLKAFMDDTVVFKATEADAANYTGYKKVAVEVKEFADGRAHIVRFEGHIAAGVSMGLYVDDVCLRNAPANDKAAPGAINDLGAVGTSTETIALSWSDVAGETQYLVQRKDTPLAPWTQVASLSSGTEFYEDSGLSSGTQYYYQVLAHNNDGDTASNQVSGYTYCVLTVRMDPPGGGGGSVTVAGKTPCYASPCVYEFAYNTTVQLKAQPNNGYVFRDWQNTSCISEQCNVLMSGDQDVTARFWTIQPPTNVQAEPVSNPGSVIGQPRSIIRVTWSYTSTADISQFIIRCIDAESNTIYAERSASAEAVEFEFADLWPCTTYRFQMATVGTGSQSDWSAPVTASTHCITHIEISGIGGGSVTGPIGVNDGINCGLDTNCDEEYVFGSSVTLTAVPDEGFQFISWEGLGALDEDNGIDCVVRMNRNAEIVANFAEDPCIDVDASYYAGATTGSVPMIAVFYPVIEIPGTFEVVDTLWYVLGPDPEEVDGVYVFPDTLDPVEVPYVENAPVYLGGADYPVFLVPGTYVVGMRVRIQDPSSSTTFICPPLGDAPYVAPDPENADNPLVLEALLETANFEAQDMIGANDGAALTPLNNWVPLFWFKMSYKDDSPAPRVLTYLEYSIHGDTAPARPYPRGGGPLEEDIFEYGLFVDNGPESKPDQVFNLEYDGRWVWRQGGYLGLPSSGFRLEPGSPMLKWDNHGFPYEMPDFAGNYNINDGHYYLNFCFDPRPKPTCRRTEEYYRCYEGVSAVNFYPTQPDGFHYSGVYTGWLNPENPKFPFLRTYSNINDPYGPFSSNYPGDNLLTIPKSSGAPDTTAAVLNWVLAGVEPQEGYIVAVRLSSLWSSTQTFAYTLHYAAMQPWAGPYPSNELILLDTLYPHDQYLVGEFPLDDDGTSFDSYSPDFWGTTHEELSEATGYSSSFDIFDISGDGISGYMPGMYHNNWNWQIRKYTPIGEHARPRWDISDTFFEAVSGEWIDLRRLFAADAWVPVIGVNMHGPNCFDQPDEINLILTDIGGDPFGIPGNGGFNPNDALEVMTTSFSGSADYAVQSDFSFNGAWLWCDTGTSANCATPFNCTANGIYDPPSAADASGASYGITFTDYPMYPADMTNQDGFVNQGINQWEYIPFPPGGGDPWWKIKMKFDGGRRRNPGDPCTGGFEPVPDAIGGFVSVADYFVVLHTDSGYRDLSGLPGDGDGIKLGADFRAFIEPRRWDPRNGGHWAGGIKTTNMMLNAYPDFDPGTDPWQDSPDWDIVNSQTVKEQPWWHERLHIQDNVKPMRCGMEVHDLVLTYSTCNSYAKETFINLGQIPPKFDPWVGFLSALHSMGNENFTDAGGLTWFSLWMDPVKIYESNDVFGIMGIRFYNLFEAGIQPDMSESIYDNTGNTDQYTSIQYSFETVPFNLKQEDATVSELGGHLEFPRSYFFPLPPEQPTLPDYTTWPPAELHPDGFPVAGSIDLSGTTIDYSMAYGAESLVYLDENTTINNTPYMEADYQPSQTPNEETYEDDVVYVELLDCSICGQNLLTDGPLYYIDSNGGKYRVLEQNGSVLTLDHGRPAYTGKYYEVSHQMLDENCDPVVDGLGDPVMSANVDFPFYPYDPCGRTGRDYAIVAGRWVLARDVLRKGQYPRMDDWEPGLDDRFTIPADKTHGDRAARILKQHIEYNSMPTAMLGINLTASDDPVVNRFAPTSLNRITVAFWGPEFSKNDLAKLDSDTGALVSSGVMLYEDTNGDGVFDGPITFGDTIVAYNDRLVALEPSSLKWANAPESIDLDGDNVPDDITGDGLVVLSESEASNYEGNPQFDGMLDLAWVLQLEPLLTWLLPEADTRNGGPKPPDVPWDKSGGMAAILPGSLVQYITAEWPSFWGAAPQIMDVSPLAVSGDMKSAELKALTRGGNQGDDLFIVIRTSESIAQFEQFRCFVPARLPSRTPLAATYAGIDIVRGLTPAGSTVGGPVEKLSPDEGAVQDFYGHDMLEAAVPSRIIDLSEDLVSTTVSPAVPVILPGGPPVAVLGIDCAANRPENLIAEGTQGETSSTVFTPGDVEADADSPYYSVGGWTNKAVGLWLVGMSAGEDQDSRLQAYEITAVNGDSLTLRGGAPRNGSRWAVVKDPTFLEQVIVEFYDQSNQTLGRHFNPYNDLLPLDIEDPANDQVSGVSLYRDNDWDSRNTNGVFDPPVLNASNELEYIDLPVRLDDPPVFIGVQGEPEYQVKLVFSSPGTDDTTGRVSVPYENQPNLRQWIPQELGTSPSQATYGSDFFVVLRTSRDMQQGDSFRVGVVSWGPITPTEPDPDTFSNILGTSQKEDEFDKFSEFPWGARGLGFITFFQNPPDMYFWTYDRVRERVAPTHEVDHSQDDRKVKYWIRSNPNQAGMTQTIYSLPQSEVDFTADRHRQVVGGDIQFTLIATGTVVEVLWDFGDGNTSTERNPLHTYSQAGFYTVSVTVTDKYGIEVTETKTDFIEIVAAPFVDFMADPTTGTITEDLIGGRGCGVDVQFTDLSVGTDLMIPKVWFWNFGDNTTSTDRAEQNPEHRYTKEGFYTVTLEVTFENSDTGATQAYTYRIQDYITVRPPVSGCGITDEGESEGESDEPPAEFKVESKIKDKESLVPLNDWVPLINFTMGYPADNPAPRLLSKLVYTLRPDEREPETLHYGNQAGPFFSDILEFGLFKENDGGDEGDLTLDVNYDELLYVWDSQGNTSFGAIGTILTDYTVEGLSLAYELDFIGDGTAAEPQFPVLAEPKADPDNGLNGASYHIAVRTSATWRSQTTLSCNVLSAQMVKESGAYPLDSENKPVDSYTPNFADGEKLEPDAAYSSSFTDWDVTAKWSEKTVPGLFDTWNAPMYLYTPPAEFTRPRWNKVSQLMDITAGEMLELRQLASVDTWTALIGINLHSTKSLHFDQYEAGIQGRIETTKEAAQLREVNVVLTDIGADPFGSPGNGGFNPNDGLEHYTTNIRGLGLEDDKNGVLAEDVTYNGLWVWHDTNNNGIFDPPVPRANGGVDFAGDYPMLPEAFVFDYYNEEEVHADDGGWEYLPFPPGGGDPWWRTTLHFYEGRRRPIAEIANKDNVDGYLEKTPDNVGGSAMYSSSDWTCDYFVVARTDSGFKDVSLAPGDNTGLTMGADFRAFIEPRRINALGVTTGGIYVDSMIPGIEAYNPDLGNIVWQQDPRWGANEPWWPERTVNEKSTKPVKFGVDVHDYVLTYESDSIYRQQTDLFFGGGSMSDGGHCFGYDFSESDPTDFSQWMDPFGLERSRFLNGHTVGVTYWRISGSRVFTLGTFTLALSYDESMSSGQFAYETVPFFHATSGQGSDLPPTGPRSSAYSQPPAQPSLPSYDTWPKTLGPNEYPKSMDWAPEDTKARLLTQKIDINSDVTPMLGLNLAGSADPFVNAREETALASITVAFWGPDFTPDDLAALDAAGQDQDSGVLLYEDTDLSGMFEISRMFEAYMDYAVPVTGLDTPVKLRNLSWPSQPELIDLDGDGVADDLDGNGLVDDSDKAWVLTLTPQDLWQVPHKDAAAIEDSFNATIGCGTVDFGADKAAVKSDSSPVVKVEEAKQTEGATEGSTEGATEGEAGVVELQPGDDLFVTVRTSEKAKRFEQFRAVIPATLPTRPEGQRKGGIQFLPQVNTSGSAGIKNNPDEGPVQDFFGHDMLEVNIPAKILDVTNQSQVITIGGAVLPVLGLDLSTNRESAGTAASGSLGTGGDKSFTVQGAAWTADVFAGDFLLDSAYEPYQIVSNTANQLNLLSGTPRTGSWRIVTEPSFLEQVIVEFYNEGTDANFNPTVDLLPLNADQELSGVALYRDNDNNPLNRNGVFDPDIDIPLPLDAAPVYIGQTAEDIQVKFVFSTPGTDDYPIPMESQTRNRQWAPDSFGGRPGDPFTGADFFVVLRASGSMTVNDNFRVGIVSWGPNTPTEPDPDTWATLSGEERNEFVKFEEFPWGARGLGFITYFKTMPMRYSLIGAKAYSAQDGSDFNWVRSHNATKRRSGVITARTKPVSPTSVVIDSASVSQLPSQTLEGQPFNLIIYGSGFGTNPVVALSGYEVEVTNANGSSISLSISTPAGTVPEEPIVLIVRNPDTGEEGSRSGLFTLKPGSEQGPEIISVSPSKGTKDIFPVTIIGKRFSDRANIDVIFENTLMPVLDVNAEGTRISVGFPFYGIPDVGVLDIKVRNADKGSEAILVGGFEYVNDPEPTKLLSKIGCGPAPVQKSGGVFGDLALMGLVALALAAPLWQARRKAKSK